MTIARDHSSGILRRRKRTHGERSLVCLLTTVHPERGLSRVLAQHLVAELPRVSFTLNGEGKLLDTVWICGFEAGAGKLVAQLRRKYPDAHLLVSGRRPSSAWAEEAVAAGADAVCGWPLSFQQLETLLRPRS